MTHEEYQLAKSSISQIYGRVWTQGKSLVEAIAEADEAIDQLVLDVVGERVFKGDITNPAMTLEHGKMALREDVHKIVRGSDG